MKTMNHKRVAFAALMKKLEIKSLVSLDKGGLLPLEFNATDDALVADINGLMKADQEIFVVLMEKSESK
jgi:hypothetical protein